MAGLYLLHALPCYNGLGAQRGAVLDWISGSAWRYFTLIFLLPLVIRANRLNQFNRRFLGPGDDRELGAIAISLAKTGELANTYIIPSGPTAHLPPLPR